MTNAIDLSFSALEGDRLDGIDLVVQDLWTGATQPASRVVNLRVAIAAGKRVAGYMVVNSQVRNVSRAQQGIPQGLWDALAFVALDCELYGTLTPLKVHAEADELAYALPDRPKVIYTRRDYWQSVLGDDASFGDHWLWDARPGDPVPPFVPYGAWRDESQVVGVQTSVSRTLGEMMVDDDVFKMEVIMPPQASVQAEVDGHEVRLRLAAAALNGDMTALVNELVYFGIVPAGTPVLKPSA